MSELKSDPLDFLSTSAAAEAPPAVLLPYQQEWIEDESQVKVAEKSRRIGLTWAEAADDVLIAAAEGGSNVFYISAAEDMAREYVEACAMWARAFDYAASEITEGIYADEGKNGAERQIKTFEVGFPRSGRRVLALSSRPSNLRGKQGVIVIDEAAFAPDLPGLLKSAMAMTMWGDKVRIISTHDGAENRFKTFIDEIRVGKRGKARVHTFPFERAVGEGLYHRVCLRKGIDWTQAGQDEWVQSVRDFYGDDVAEELDVIPSQGGGRYLSLALISQRMTAAWSAENPRGPAIVRGRWADDFAYLPDDAREYAIKGWLAEHVLPHLKRLSPLQRHVFGQDFARSVDLSVITVLAEDHDLTHRVRLVIELGNCPFSSQEQILFYVVDWLKQHRFRGGAMDATGNGAALAEKAAQRYGVEMVEQVRLNQGFYAAHMPKLKAGLQDGTLTDIPRDDGARDDLRAIELVRGVPMVPHVNTASTAARAEAAEAGAGKHGRRHGDFAISLFLAEYAFHREAGEIDFIPAPARAGRWDGPADEGRGAMHAADDFADMTAGFDAKGGW